jgi:tRNA(fMet)-specific endonuclease VapC
MGITRFLLDSGIASDYVNRRHGVDVRARAEVNRGNVIGIGTPILAELVSGIEQSDSRDRNMKSLKAAICSWKLWAFDDRAAFEFGRINAELTRKGRPMQVVDVMIAAIAFSLGNCAIVTTDSDLAAISGLKVENWRQAAPGPVG